MKTLCRTSLETSRLLFRRPRLMDAPVIHHLAGDARVASAALIPHPYTLAHALAWFDSIADDFLTGAGATFLLERQDEPGVIGSIGLILDERDERSACVSFWIGHPYWGQGYATEALAEMLRYGFADLGLSRIHAHHLISHPAAGRVLQKAGLVFDSVAPIASRWTREVHDQAIYELTAGAWRKLPQARNL